MVVVIYDFIEVKKSTTPETSITKIVEDGL